MPVIHRALVLAATLAVAGATPASTHAAPPVTAPDGLAATPAAARAVPRALTAGDPRGAEAWHLDGDGPMGVRSAWAHTTGGDVTVAVLDSGIDLDHPDLAPNLWTNPGEIPGNGRDDDGDGVVDDVHGTDLVNGDGVPEDDNGHGTHVAGVIGAAGGNGIGASGVAWRVRLMAVKVLDRNAGGDTGTVARGIEWAVRHGARVVNLSLAGAGRSTDLENAILTAQRAGVLIVVAAGNEHHDLGLLPSYPASYPQANVLGVAATRPDALLSLVSSFGPGADLAAPGESIFSTALGGGYEYRTGTSMAAPMVAGAAALLLAADPAADAARVATVLQQSARRTGLPVGAGALDVGMALGGPVPGAVAPAAPPAPSATVAAAAAAAKARRAKAAKARAARTRAARAKAAKAKAAKAKAAKARGANTRVMRARAAKAKAAKAKAARASAAKAKAARATARAARTRAATRPAGG